MGIALIVAPHSDMEASKLRRIQLVNLVVALPYCFLMFYPGVPAWQIMVFGLIGFAGAVSTMIADYQKRKS